MHANVSGTGTLFQFLTLTSPSLVDQSWDQKTRNLMVSYQRHYGLDKNLNCTDVNNQDKREERRRKIRTSLERVQGDGILLPASLVAAETAPFHSQRRDMALLNYISHQFARLKKYCSRGITMEGLPSGALEFQIHDVCWNGFIKLENPGVGGPTQGNAAGRVAEDNGENAEDPFAVAFDMP